MVAGALTACSSNAPSGSGHVNASSPSTASVDGTVITQPPLKYEGDWVSVQTGKTAGATWDLYQVASTQGTCFAIDTVPTTTMPSVPAQLSGGESFAWQGKFVHYRASADLVDDGEPVDLDDFTLPGGARLFFGVVAPEVQATRALLDDGSSIESRPVGHTLTIVVPRGHKMKSLVPRAPGTNMRCSWDGDEIGFSCSGSVAAPSP